MIAGYVSHYRIKSIKNISNNLYLFNKVDINSTDTVSVIVVKMYYVNKLLNMIYHL